MKRFTALCSLILALSGCGHILNFSGPVEQRTAKLEVVSYSSDYMENLNHPRVLVTVKNTGQLDALHPSLQVIARRNGAIADVGYAYFFNLDRFPAGATSLVSVIFYQLDEEPELYDFSFEFSYTY